MEVDIPLQICNIIVKHGSLAIEPETTPMPDHLLEALLKARCPKDCKELLFALIRLSGTYQTTHHEVSFASMSRYMDTERYKVMDCLDELLKFKMVRKTKDPRFPKAMCLVVNSNYTEWTCLKLPQDESNCLSAKDKTSSPEAKPASEAKSPKTGHHGSRKKSNKNSKIRKNYHSHGTTSFSAGKEQINKNPEILKFYHSHRTSDVDPALILIQNSSFIIQHSSFSIQHFPNHRPRAPAQ